MHSASVNPNRAAAIESNTGVMDFQLLTKKDIKAEAWPIDVPSSRGNHAEEKLFKLDVTFGIRLTSVTSEWREVDIQQMMQMLVARMTAKVFLGQQACCQGITTPE
ncbi:hypothetical protein F5X97DRAFT_341291 [Nemania serpens]|nr:hypothetical protein F5X97DRAFT_341291 [Nemania serpens]